LIIFKDSQENIKNKELGITTFISNKDEVDLMVLIHEQ
jgi:hypothetical protein